MATRSENYVLLRTFKYNLNRITSIKCKMFDIFKLLQKFFRKTLGTRYFVSEKFNDA